MGSVIQFAAEIEKLPIFLSIFLFSRKQLWRAGIYAGFQG